MAVSRKSIQISTNATTVQCLMKVAHIQLFNLGLTEKVLSFTGLWNTAYCKMYNFWELQICIKAEGTKLIIFWVDTHIGLKFCWSSWIEMYFRTMPLCWCYLTRGAQTSIFYEHTTYMCTFFRLSVCLCARRFLCE